ncbi:MAG: oligosaccharide flippase family protein, partial [Planctomycetaceae bacterium]|nr:oligosaccharide flippase family protein [Planctomycetaceae bacterium]
GLLYMGFGAAVCRYSSRYYSLQDWPGLNRILSSIFTVYAFNSLIALAASGLAAFAAPWISDWEGQSIAEVRQVMLILGLNAAVSLWGSVFGGLLIGMQRFDIHRGVMISSTLVRFGLIVAGLRFAPSLWVMASVFLTVTVLENVVYYVMCRRLAPQLDISWRHVSRDALRECYGFTAFNALGMVSDYLISLTDTVVIGCMLGTAATVPYYIALRLAQMIKAPLEQVAEVLIPKAGELQAREQDQKLQRLVVQATGVSLLLIAGFTIGAGYFGDRLLTTWLGGGNEESLPILMVLLAAQFVVLPLRVPKMVLLGLGDIRTPALFDVTQAVANLALSLILVRYWGVLGVAVGTLIPALVCELGLLLPYASRKLHLGARPLLVETIIPQIPAVAALWVYCELVSAREWPDGWASLIVITAGGGAVLLAVRGGVYWLTRRSVRSANAAQEMVTT